MPLYDPTHPKSVESFTINAALSILSNCPSVQELLEANTPTQAASLILPFAPIPTNNDTFTKEELQQLGMWSTLGPPQKGAALRAGPSMATQIRDLDGELVYRMHRMVRDGEYEVVGGRADVWSFVRDRTAAIVEEFAGLADPYNNDKGLHPFAFARDGVPLWNPSGMWESQGRFIETYFLLHYGRQAAQ